LDADTEAKVKKNAGYCKASIVNELLEAAKVQKVYLNPIAEEAGPNHVLVNKKKVEKATFYL
jgi:hypothetical protein